MRFGKLEINPALSPGVLDTATWDRDAAWAAIQAIEDAYWSAVIDGRGRRLRPCRRARGLTPLCTHLPPGIRTRSTAWPAWRTGSRSFWKSAGAAG